MGFHDEYDNGMDSRYSLPFHRQGIPTSPMTPKQLEELGKSLNMGVRNVEVGHISGYKDKGGGQGNFESIPIQHFDEMRRLAKLSDSKITMHAPIIDPAGFEQSGWSEENRKETEGYLNSVLDRAQRLDPEGNIPVALHTTGAMLPGTKYGVDREGNKRTQSIFAISREDGKQAQLVHKERHGLIDNKPISFTPEDQLRSLNNNEWSNDKLQLASSQMKVYDLMEQRKRLEMDMRPYEVRLAQINKGELNFSDLSEEERSGIENYNRMLLTNENQINEFNQDIIRRIDSMHENLQKYKSKDETESQVDDYERELSEFRGRNDKLDKEIRGIKTLAFKPVDNSGKQKQLHNKYKNLQNKKVELFKDMSNVMSKRSAPEKFVSSEDFHTEKVGDTVSNSAFAAYSKFGENAPIIALENVYGDNVLSRAETLKEVIVESRDKLKNKLIDKKNMSNVDAKKIAEKLIGATWDVGHINMLRKEEYEGSLSEEEFKKLIKKQAKDIAPYTKHVHISDNFGFSDAHLAPGMGTSPIKEQLKDIDKEARDAVHVMEGGAYAGQFQDNPLPYTLESMDSPMYSHEMGPNWGQVRDMYSSYMVGMGDVLPERYFNEYGVSFAKLPRELGGQLFGGGTPKKEK